MLPNHAPLMVAERFKVLEALFPGRIDLGLGRAPGTDQITSYRAAPAAGRARRRRFPRTLPGTAAARARAAFPDGHPFRNVRAMPADVPLPPIYLLGSSGYSAELAAAIGAGFSFAHHFADHDAVAAMTSYRDDFRPSAALAEAACHPRGRGGLRRHRRGGRAARLDRRPQLRAPLARANTCRWRARRRPRPIPIRRSTASASAQNRARAVRRHAGDRARAARRR